MHSDFQSKIIINKPYNYKSTRGAFFLNCNEQNEVINMEKKVQDLEFWSLFAFIVVITLVLGVIVNF